MLGQTILHYQIIEKLGEGGMGVVYRAHDLQLDRPVALKFLSERFAGQGNARLRFEREARAAAALNHPNIIVVYEIGEYEGRPFMSMPYVEGEILSDLIARGPLPVERAIDIVRQIALGLDRAHRAGIIHRDIKPGNILVDADGRVKILDFGLASVSTDTRLTIAESVIGTVHYMSPEQARGGEVDGRSDIFSLGTVMYEMVTGRLPFTGERLASVLYAIEHAQPPVPDLAEGNAAPLAVEVVMTMLAKNPDDRYATAGAVAADLGAGTVSGSGSVSLRRKRPLPRAVVIGAVCAALLAGIFWRVVQQPVSAGDGRGADGRTLIAVLPFVNLGVADDEYLADGVTEEITGRLAAVPEFGVISRTSTLQYKGSQKSIKQIGRELGVDYVLEGTVRWGGGQTKRVRITPELIRVSDDTQLWSQQYDRSGTDLFKIQSEIAEQVSEKLNVSLMASTREYFASQPTENFEAYQAYRRGLEAERSAPYDDETMDLAVAMFERAVGLDPDFALAHARLSQLYSQLYHMGYRRTDQQLAMAKAAADSALKLDSRLPEARLALAYYYYWGFKDYDAALAELEAVGLSTTDDSLILEARGYINRRQGRYSESAANLERALRLTPRNSVLTIELANTYLGLWRFEDAQRLYDQAISLAPDETAPYTLKVRNILLWTGDLGAARAVLADMPASHELRAVWFRAFQAFCEGNDQVVIDLLEPRRAETYETHAQSVPVPLMMAWAHERVGETAAAAKAYENALALLRARLAEQPDDFRIHMALGLVLAGLGHREDALRHGEQAMALNPATVDAWSNPIMQRNLLFLLVRVGETDSALELLDDLLSTPNPGASPALMRIEPRLESLRADPRCRQILTRLSARGEGS